MPVAVLGELSLIRPLCGCMGRERKARILKSEYLLLDASERLRDYDKYENQRGRQREIETDMGKEAEERTVCFSISFFGVSRRCQAHMGGQI